MQKVVVHVGAPKVASTSIQSFLRRNAGRLREQGIYPLDSTLLPIKPDGTSPMGPDLQFEAILGGPDDVRKKTSALIDRYCQAFDAEARNAKGGVIVWSAENLTRLSADRSVLLAAFREVSRRFDLEVMLYVRRPDLWLESYWKQFALKIHQESPARWALRRAGTGYPDFLAAARAWEEAVGHDRIAVRPLDPAALWNGSLLEDFAARLGATGLDCSMTNENRMLHPAFLAFCHRHADILFLGPHDTRLFDWAEVVGLFARSDSRILGPMVRQQVLALLADNNRALLTEFCPVEAPALMPDWCPALGTAEIPASDLDPPQSPGRLATLERIAAWFLAQGLRVHSGLIKH
ncbi:hypothetical protein [Hypericibacter sp.]|uniref:hypothetical protein n=1 Tax=Hypericibacter sp. TaxID=2705401 RepID=UPI003D6D6665